MGRVHKFHSMGSNYIVLLLLLWWFKFKTPLPLQQRFSESSLLVKDETDETRDAGTAQKHAIP